MIKRIIVISAALLLSGCAHFHSRGMVYKEAKLFVWGSDYSAGIGTANGICAQAATTMRAANLDVDVSASNDFLKAAIPTLAPAEQGELIDLGIAQTQTVAATNVSTSQTAFANIAFFYLCQISLNSQVEDASIVAMWKDTTAALSSVGATTATITTIRPDAVNTGTGRDVTIGTRSTPSTPGGVAGTGAGAGAAAGTGTSTEDGEAGPGS